MEEIKDNIKRTESGSVKELGEELTKGIQSMKNGEVHTIEEAWIEIDKI